MIPNNLDKELLLRDFITEMTENLSYVTQVKLDSANIHLN